MEWFDHNTVFVDEEIPGKKPEKVLTYIFLVKILTDLWRRPYNNHRVVFMKWCTVTITVSLCLLISISCATRSPEPDSRALLPSFAQNIHYIRHHHGQDVLAVHIGQATMEKKRLGPAVFNPWSIIRIDRLEIRINQAAESNAPTGGTPAGDAATADFRRENLFFSLNHLLNQDHTPLVEIEASNLTLHLGPSLQIHAANARLRSDRILLRQVEVREGARETTAARAVVLFDPPRLEMGGLDGEIMLPDGIFHN